MKCPYCGKDFKIIDCFDTDRIDENTMVLIYTGYCDNCHIDVDYTEFYKIDRVEVNEVRRDGEV